MIQSRQNIKRLILIVGDLAVFELALALTLLIRYGHLNAENWNQHVWPFTILSCFWVVSFYVAGLYDLTLLREPLRLFRTYLEGMIANLALALAFFYLIPIFGISPRTNLFLHFAVSLLLGYLWRLGFNSFVADRFARGQVLFIGPSGEARQMFQLLQASTIGLNLAAAVSTSGTTDPTLPIEWIPNVEQLEPVMQGQKFHAIVLGVRPDEIPGLKNALYRSLFTTVFIMDRAEIEEMATGRIPLSHVSETWFLHHLREAEKAWYETFKRAVDILLAIPFGLLTLVLLPFLALAIKLTSPGPVFYSQTRVGKGGKLIRIWKFRSMIPNAETDGAQFTASTATDPRVTNVGKFLRSTRLDELPQIWNVLRGDLSFIGPRPERPEFVAPLVERMPHYTLRHLTRPGLTGWAQVRFLTPTASLEDNLKKLQYDLFYIKNRSVLLDVAILLKTIGIVLRRQGT